MPRENIEVHAINEFLGSHIRAMARSRDISNRVLAEELGITTQQLSKYLRGESRIAAGHMPILARVLGVRVDLLYGAYDAN